MSPYMDEVLAMCTEVGNCLEWLGPFGTRRNGTSPIFRKYLDGRTRNFAVPRMVWESRNGPVPEGRIVYRSCCNDRCVGCVKLGVPGDAQRHRGAMGKLRRAPDTIAAVTRGARARANVKCSEAIAEEIRGLLLEGVADHDVAARTGMSIHIVRGVRLNRRWLRRVSAASVFDWRPA